MSSHLKPYIESGQTLLQTSLVSPTGCVNAGQRCRVVLPNGKQVEAIAQTAINSSRVMIAITDDMRALAWCSTAARQVEQQTPDLIRSQPEEIEVASFVVIGNVLPAFINDELPSVAEVTWPDNYSIPFATARGIYKVDSKGRSFFAQFEFTQTKKVSAKLSKTLTLKETSFAYSDRRLIGLDYRNSTAIAVAGYNKIKKGSKIYEPRIKNDFATIYKIFYDALDPNDLFEIVVSQRPKDEYQITVGIPFRFNRLDSSIWSGESAYDFEEFKPFLESDILGLSLQDNLSLSVAYPSSVDDNYPNQSIRYIWRVVTLGEGDTEGQILFEGYVDRDGIFRGEIDVSVEVSIDTGNRTQVNIDLSNVKAWKPIDSNSGNDWNLSSYFESGAIDLDEWPAGTFWTVTLGNKGPGYVLGTVQSDGSLGGIINSNPNYWDDANKRIDDSSADLYGDMILSLGLDDPGALEMQIGYVVLGQRIVEISETTATLTLAQYFPSLKIDDDSLDVIYETVTLDLPS